MNKFASAVIGIVVVLLALGAGYFLAQRQSSGGQPTPTPSGSTSPLPSASPTPTPHPLITVATPQPEEQVGTPLIVTGQARGPWFFEASFPVVLTNWDGIIIAQGSATAQGEWMTENFVPFSATLEFTKPPSGERGFLILQKANASGLPEKDDAIEIPVFFQ